MGGHVYRGREHAAHLDGLYIFGDNGSGRIWALAGGNEAVYLCNMPAGTALTGLVVRLLSSEKRKDSRFLVEIRQASGGDVAPPAGCRLGSNRFRRQGQIGCH